MPFPIYVEMNMGGNTQSIPMSISASGTTQIPMGTDVAIQPLPHITIGEVTTLDTGEDATATMTGDARTPVLNLGLPRGEKGEQGEQGDDYVLTQSDKEDIADEVKYDLNMNQYAKTADVETALAGKQPVGDYATNDALTAGLAAKQDSIYLTDDSAQRYIVTSMEEATVNGVHGFVLYAENVSWFFPDGVGLSAVLTSVNTAIAEKQPVGDYATNSDLNSGLAEKEDTISDLATIRSGAALGATALQSESDPVFSASVAAGITSSNVSNWNNKQDAIPDLSAIRSGASLGATALQSESDPIFSASAASGITATDISNWNSKQNAGDYATNSELASGLATKQDVGDYAYSASGDSTHTAIRSAGILFGQVDSTSTSTAFTATIPGVTKYYDGLAIMLKNGVVTSASGFTIDVNGLGAKHSYNNLAEATADTTLFNINYTMLFVYDSTRVSGGGWICYRGYDANTNTIGYQIRTNSTTMPMKSITYRYRLLFTAADGQGFVPANNSTSTNATAIRAVCQDKIDPFGSIYYYGTTASVAAGSRPGAAYLWQQYVLTLGYSFNMTGAALVLSTYDPVYVVATPQADGSAILDPDTPYVQALPTTQDGKIYIFLGVANAATTLELNINHPVYCYKDGGIRPWDGYVITTA